MTELKTLEDVEQFYTLAKEKHPDIIGFGRGGILPQMVNGVIESDMNVFRLNNFVSTDGTSLMIPLYIIIMHRRNINRLLIFSEIGIKRV